MSVIAIHSAPSQWFVSCVMPTTARRSKFLPLAIRCFIDQKLKDKELLIVADPDQLIVLPDFARNRKDIRIVRAGPLLGAKHNAAKEEARGNYIAKTDDDDYFGPRRLLHQLEPIALGRADCTAYPDSHSLDLVRGQWMYSKKNNMWPFHDATLFFDKNACREIEFGNIRAGEGLIFARRLRRMGLRLLVIENFQDFVYMRHGRNTWRFRHYKLYNPSKRPSFFSPDLETQYRNAIR
jgi:glycosyltransferase involved in cell wall biosynthesis